MRVCRRMIWKTCYEQKLEKGYFSQHENESALKQWYHAHKEEEYRSPFLFLLFLSFFIGTPF